MILNLKERIRMESFIPQQGDRLSLTIARDIMKKIEISPAERESVKMRNHPSMPGALIWGSSNEVQATEEDIVLSIPFSEAELTLLRTEAKKKNDDRTLNINDLDLYGKIMDDEVKPNIIEAEIV